MRRYRYSRPRAKPAKTHFKDIVNSAAVKQRAGVGANGRDQRGHVRLHTFSTLVQLAELAINVGGDVQLLCKEGTWIKMRDTLVHELNGGPGDAAGRGG